MFVRCHEMHTRQLQHTGFETLHSTCGNQLRLKHIKVEQSQFMWAPREVFLKAYDTRFSFTAGKVSPGLVYLENCLKNVNFKPAPAHWKSGLRMFLVSLNIGNIWNNPVVAGVLVFMGGFGRSQAHWGCRNHPNSLENIWLDQIHPPACFAQLGSLDLGHLSQLATN